MLEEVLFMRIMKCGFTTVEFDLFRFNYSGSAVGNGKLFLGKITMPLEDIDESVKQLLNSPYEKTELRDEARVLELF